MDLLVTFTPNILCICEHFAVDKTIGFTYTIPPKF